MRRHLPRLILVCIVALMLAVPKPALAKGRDVVMITVGTISVALIGLFIYAAVRGDKKKEEPKVAHHSTEAEWNEDYLAPLEEHPFGLKPAREGMFLP